MSDKYADPEYIKRYRSGVLWGATVGVVISNWVWQSGFAWWLPFVFVGGLYAVCGLLFLGRKEAERSGRKTDPVHNKERP